MCDGHCDVPVCMRVENYQKRQHHVRESFVWIHGRRMRGDRDYFRVRKQFVQQCSTKTTSRTWLQRRLLVFSHLQSVRVTGVAQHQVTTADENFFRC